LNHSNPTCLVHLFEHARLPSTSSEKSDDFRAPSTELAGPKPASASPPHTRPDSCMCACSPTIRRPTQFLLLLLLLPRLLLFREFSGHAPHRSLPHPHSTEQWHVVLGFRIAPTLDSPPLSLSPAPRLLRSSRGGRGPAAWLCFVQFARGGGRRGRENGHVMVRAGRVGRPGPRRPPGSAAHERARAHLMQVWGRAKPNSHPANHAGEKTVVACQRQTRIDRVMSTWPAREAAHARA
jgi:hypothetical protein